MKSLIKTTSLRATRGRLLNYAVWLHDLPFGPSNTGPGRFLQVYPDDWFIVSYPRSGNTWTRFLMANLLHPEVDVDYANIERLVPDIYITPETVLRTLPQPRLLKSHECFDPRYRRVIYVVRNPIDVALSQYHTLRRAREGFSASFGEFVTRYLAGEFDAWFGSWEEHVNSWIHHDRRDKPFLLVRYEDLRADALSVLQKIATFMGLPAEPAHLSRAVERSGKDYMAKLYKADGKSLEKNIGRFTATFLAPGDARPAAEIEPAEIDRLLQRYAPTMEKLGYSLTYSLRPDAR